MIPSPNDIALDSEERRILADAAQKTGIPWRLLLRQAIAHFTKAHGKPRQSKDATAHPETLLEKLQRLGAVGMIVGGPLDLSTNKKHMDEFGKDQ
jgi:hypothetical protein